MMAEPGFVDLPDTCTVAEALCMYSAHKGWCTRYTNKIEKAQPLLDKQYDRRTDELVAENLKKAENEACNVAKDVKCKKCNATGHASPGKLGPLMNNARIKCRILP